MIINLFYLIKFLVLLDLKNLKAWQLCPFIQKKYILIKEKYSYFLQKKHSNNHNKKQLKFVSIKLYKPQSGFKKHHCFAKFKGVTKN